MFVLHGTSFENCLSILKNKTIYCDSKTGMLEEDNPKQIFMQLIYRDIRNQENLLPFWFEYCFVFSPEILKIYPFYANHIGEFSKTFEEGMMKKEPEKYACGHGNLKIMPKLSNLKEEIDDYMKKFNLDNITFMYSHEILFGNDIPLQHCLGIVVRTPFPDKLKNDKDYKKLMKLTKECNLFLTMFPYSTREELGLLNGLNDFIDIVEKIQK
jgi:hypothetical protein